MTCCEQLVNISSVYLFVPSSLDLFHLLFFTYFSLRQFSNAYLFPYDYGIHYFNLNRHKKYFNWDNANDYYITYVLVQKTRKRLKINYVPVSPSSIKIFSKPSQKLEFARIKETECQINAAPRNKSIKWIHKKCDVFLLNRAYSTTFLVTHNTKKHEERTKSQSG